MVVDINSITAHLFENMPAKPNRYEVRIVGGVGNKVPDASRTVMFNCSGVTIPGISLETLQQRKYTMGYASTVVDAKQFTDCTMTFYESEFEKERRYFVEWYDLIIDPVTKRIGFHDDYVKNIEILQYNVKNEMVYKATLYKAMPVNISSLDRGYDKGDQVPTFNVALKFYDIQEEFFQRSK